MGEACLQDTNLTAMGLYGQKMSGHEPENTAWYALKVRTGGEPMAIAALTYRGFNPYCPAQMKRRRYSDRIKVVAAPVFPGYVFCQFEARQKLSVISSPGVDYIVGFANGPVPVPEEEIMAVRRMIEAGACPTPTPANGQKVRVTGGPLTGVEGTVVRDGQKCRLVVSINLLNLGASIQVDESDVCVFERDCPPVRPQSSIHASREASRVQQCQMDK